MVTKLKNYFELILYILKILLAEAVIICYNMHISVFSKAEERMVFCK